MNRASVAMARRALLAGAGAYVLLTAGFAAAAGPGSLDHAFGGDGKVTTNFPGPDDSGFASVLQPDGRLVVGGYSTPGGQEDFALARYLTNGNLDKTFSGDGKVTTDFAGGDDEIYGLAIQGNGRIVAVGFATEGGENRFAVVRYDPGGSLDDTFGGDGKVTTDLGTNAIALDVRVLGSGKILVAGGATPAGSEQTTIVRYMPDGTPDTTFDGDGTASTIFPEGEGRAFDLTVHGGKYVTAGWVTNNAGDRIFSIARWGNDGMLDQSFGGDGRVTTPFPGGDAQAFAVIVLSNGKLLVAGDGFRQASGGRDFAVARYKSNGNLDPTFSGDGIASADFGSDTDDALDMVVQPDGRIVLGGSGGEKFRFALARFKPGGALDKTFGSGGKVRTAFPGPAEIWGLSLRSNGRLVAGGYADLDPSAQTSDGFAAARYVT